MWVVIKEFNDYNQHGHYFVSAYNFKPGFRDLKVLLPRESDATVGKLSKGGGRESNEDCWYYLTEVEEGVSYES